MSSKRYVDEFKIEVLKQATGSLVGREAGWAGGPEQVSPRLIRAVASPFR